MIGQIKLVTRFYVKIARKSFESCKKMNLKINVRKLDFTIVPKMSERLIIDS